MTAANRNGALATSLSADPFSSLAVHYGMLLGVPDFQALMANPRGKLRLHQSWQHGPGVVWGYPVSVRPDSAELRVGPGLAVDGLGREVSLAVEHCIDVAQWLDEHETEADPVVSGDVRTFNAQVVLRYRACLTRPVPAMSSGCEGAGSDTAYSRVLETAELILRPYPNDENGDPDPPPDDRGAAFPLLRALVREGALPGDDADPPDPPVTGGLHAFRTLAAREARALAPPAYGPATAGASSTRLFPVDEPGEIVLADLPALQVSSVGPVLTAPTLDHSVRRTHLPTWVIEELLAELAAGQATAFPDAGGPRVTAVNRAATTVTVSLTADVVEGTIAGALSVHSFDAAAADPAWVAEDVTASTTFTPAAAGPPPTPATVSFDLPAEPTADRTFRLVLRGTGDTPLVGLVEGRPVPLAGRAGGPAGGPAAGHDVTEVFTS